MVKCSAWLFAMVKCSASGAALALALASSTVLVLCAAPSSLADNGPAVSEAAKYEVEVELMDVKVQPDSSLLQLKGEQIEATISTNLGLSHTRRGMVSYAIDPPVMGASLDAAPQDSAPARIKFVKTPAEPRAIPDVGFSSYPISIAKNVIAIPAATGSPFELRVAVRPLSRPDHKFVSTGDLTKTIQQETKLAQSGAHNLTPSVQMDYVVQKEGGEKERRRYDLRFQFRLTSRKLSPN